MNNLNTVLVEGLLTRDPERLASSSETVACRLPIANNRYYVTQKDGRWKQDTSFFNVTVFGPVADACMRFLKRGRGVRVVGRLKQFRYEEGGIRRERVTIMAEHIEFAPEKKTEKEEVPDAGRLPGEIQTSANIEELKAQAEAESVAEPEEPETRVETGDPDPDVSPDRTADDDSDAPF